MKVYNICQLQATIQLDYDTELNYKKPNGLHFEVDMIDRNPKPEIYKRFNGKLAIFKICHFIIFVKVFVVFLICQIERDNFVKLTGHLHILSSIGFV